MNSQCATQKIVPNSEKLPLPEYYNSLPDVRNLPVGALSPKNYFLDIVSKVTERPVSTLRRWVAGTSNPAPLEKQAIANLINSSVETLFPESC